MLAKEVMHVAFNLLEEPICRVFITHLWSLTCSLPSLVKYRGDEMVATKRILAVYEERKPPSIQMMGPLVRMFVDLIAGPSRKNPTNKEICLYIVKNSDFLVSVYKCLEVGLPPCVLQAD